jgi:hypothetical protein
MRDVPEFEAVERELSPTLSGLIWLHGQNLVPVLDDYLQFAEMQNQEPDPEWKFQMRAQAEEEVRRTKYPRYPSKASIPKAVLDGEFEQAVGQWMDDKWRQVRTSFSADDRARLLEFKGLAQMLSAVAVQVELQANYIRYQARVMTEFR